MAKVFVYMGLEKFWNYLIDNGWQIPPFPQDDDGNFECPFCNYTISRKVEMDKAPEYEPILYCPRCGEIEESDE